MKSITRHRRWRLLLAALSPGAILLFLVLGGAANAAGGGVQIAIAPSRCLVAQGEVFTTTVAIAAPEQPLQGVDVYLDYDPAYLEVVDADGEPATALEPGKTLPVILQNRVDNAAGQIAYSAGITLGTEAITGTFAVAVIHFRCLAPIPAGGTPIAFAFDTARHRVTQVAYRGLPVLGAHQDGQVHSRQTWLVLPLILKMSSRLP